MQDEKYACIENAAVRQAAYGILSYNGREAVRKTRTASQYYAVEGRCYWAMSHSSTWLKEPYTCGSAFTSRLLTAPKGPMA